MATTNDGNKVSDFGKRVSDATISMHEAISRKMGLTGTDHKYLNLVLKRERLTAGELAALTGLTTGAITGLIDRLEKRKFVKREVDKTDRRKIFLVPDYDKINKSSSASHLHLKTQIEDLLSGYSAKEKATIEKFLNAAVDIMDTITNQLNKK